MGLQEAQLTLHWVLIGPAPGRSWVGGYDILLTFTCSGLCSNCEDK